MNWDNAQGWMEKANEGKQPNYSEPNWSWDCGLKLDFDGGLLHVSSRFYQEREDIFSGTVSFYINDDKIFAREFNCKHLDALKTQVEMYVNTVTSDFKTMCKNNMAVFIGPMKEF